MLKMLATLGEDVTALAIRRGANDEEELAYFKGTSLRIRLFDPPAARPFLERKLRSAWRSGWELAASEFGRAARAEAGGNYDAILAEHPAAARVVEKDPRTVLSLHCLRYVDLQPDHEDGAGIDAWQRIQARRAELSTCRRVSVIRVLSAQLEQLLRAEGIERPIRVVPLCIDSGLYEPQPAPVVPTVGVLGSMFWPPSRRAAMHFVTRLVPRIRALRPDVRFLVGGWRAEQYLRPVVRDSDVEILDSFSHPAQAFARLSVLVYAPPVGTGMKVKVLEAMAYGVPTVVNEEGFEGLEVDPNAPVRRATSDDEIVAQILDLLQDVEARRYIAQEGRRCIERSFSPLVVAKALRRVLEERNGMGRR